MQISRLDHLVLTVADIERTCDFYAGVLGMEVVTFGEGRRALRFGQQKINLHVHGAGFEPTALLPTPGSADLCFLVDTPVEAVADALANASIDVIEGPVRRTGAEGPVRSVYCRDPDGNLIELSNPL